MDRSNQNLRTGNDHDLAYPFGRSPVVQNQPAAGRSSGSTRHTSASGDCHVLCGAYGGNGGHVFHDGSSRCDEAMGRVRLSTSVVIPVDRSMSSKMRVLVDRRDGFHRPLLINTKDTTHRMAEWFRAHGHLPQ